MKLLITVSNNTCIKIKSYCLVCRKNTENINLRVSKTSNGRTMVLSKCAICDSKTSNLLKIKKQKDY